jgi:protein RecA
MPASKTSFSNGERNEMVRVRLEEPKDEIEERDNSYFTRERPVSGFVRTGSTLLDCVLGGGWALGRMANLVGDKSTSKTALGTEALINFVRQYPEGVARYRETEGAWDAAYAEAMGLPVDEIDFGDEDKPIVTVEDFARDLEGVLDKHIKDKVPGLYVLDSFDALSDEAEQSTDIGKGTYGMGKAKASSVMFRKLTRKLEQSNVSLLIISQIRENIGVSFGEKYRRAGGKALDFYAAQIIWLAHLGRLKKTIKGVEKAYGIEVKAANKKNKVGMPFRDCEFDFIFGYGVDDVNSCIDYLKKYKRLDVIDVVESKVKMYRQELDDLGPKAFKKECERVAKATEGAWREIETGFLPKRKKYY